MVKRKGVRYEPKGFYNDAHEPLERDKPMCTKRGIILYKGRGDYWYLEFPDGTGRIKCYNDKAHDFNLSFE